MAAMTREHAEEFLLWLAAQPHLAAPPGFSSMASYVHHLRRQAWLDGLLDQLTVELRKGGRKTSSKLPSSIPQSNPPSTPPRSVPPKAAVHIEDPGDRQDYEEWTTNTRLKWNLNALKAFKALKDGQIKRTGLVGRALRAYTGWGGFTRIFSVLGDVDPELFTPEFAQAFSMWKAAEKLGRPAPSSVLVAEEALRTQYFTPINVAETMWDYALQLFAGEEIRHVLEPSAGIGRFLDAVPSRKIDPTFYACEYDPRLADLLITRQPDAIVHVGPFESYNVTQGMDLVIGNPPFMDRSRKLLETARPDISRAEHFALIKGLHALRPGGVLLTVTPGSLVTGTTREQISYRAEMYQRGDFRGAVMLPSSCFPGVPGVIVIQAWSRRKTRRSAEEASALASAPYIIPEVNKLGVWVDGFRGGRVEGIFDAGKAEDVQWLPASEIISGGDQWSRVPDAESTPKNRRKARTSGGVTAAANTIDFEARSLTLLGMRLSEYYKRLRRPEDLTLAEIGREELLTDLQAHLSRWPQIPLANIDRETVRNAWMRYQREGVSSTPLVDIEERPQPDATPHDTVVHFCRIRGYATDEDLETYFPGEAVVDLLISQGVLLEPVTNGYRYYTELFFLTGNLTARVEAIRAGLDDATLPENVLSALRTGLQKLETVTENMSIYALRVVPRSGLVPFDILAAWATEYVGNTSFKLQSDGVLYKMLWQNKPVEQYYLMRKESVGTADAWDGILTRCVHLLGYLNREDKVDLGGTNRHAVFKNQIGFDGRQTQETEIKTTFNQWIQQPDQRAYAERIEQEYTERMPQQRGRVYSTEPYPIARKSGGITLHAHQNQSVRQQIDQTGGLILDAVGSGKTLLSCASLALWRQMGRSRRTIIVVPNNNRLQWATQIHRFFPDYSVCLMGITGRREDSQAERLTKWQAFRDGMYEVMVVGHHGFLRDVYVDEDVINEQISEQEWLQRSAGRKLADIKRAQDVLTALERGKVRQLQQFEAARDKMLDDDQYDRRLGRSRADEIQATYQKRVTEYLTQIDAEIARATERLSKLKPPTDKEIMDAIGAAEERASVGFRPDNAANLISWGEILGDNPDDVTLIVDEVHYYKNLWFPEARLGAGTIAYMGSTKSTKASQDGEDKGLTLLCWDLLFKTNMLTKRRTDKQGVMLMTATPFKNSPLELYNLGCYLGEDFWRKIGINHKEDFIDRYLEIAETTYVNPGDITPRVGPGVIRFKERDLKDLVSYLAPVLQRRTKEDLQAAGIIRLPERVAHQIPVEMTGIQRRVSDALKTVAELRIYRRQAIKENKEAGPSGAWVETISDPFLADVASKLTTIEWTEEAESSANLMILDLLRKIATDPRLLLNDWERVYGGADSVGENIEGAQAASDKKGKKGKRNSDISDATRFVYDHVFEVLSVLGISPEILRVKQTSEKLRRAARMLADSRKKQLKETGKADGSLVFLDYVDAHEWLISELVALGVPRNKIARISGDVNLTLRDEIANGKFNSADQPVHGGFNGVQEIRDSEGVVIRAACEPEYDILIGTSGAMAEGLNLQYRTSALYHLTYTWEPATIEQREGRAIRQGNVHSKVDIYQVFSEQSFDGVLINVSEGKASWQNEVFKGNAPMFQQDSDSDREDLLIKHVVRDPEAARELFAQIRAERQAAEAIRNKRAAWELYLRCYRTLRQRETEPSAERKDALLAGMRAVLRDTPRHIVGQLPPVALNMMSRGQICFPDMTNKHVYLLGDQQVSGELATKTVRILTAQVTDTAIQLYFRELSGNVGEVDPEIFNVTSTGIYRPGYVSGAERIAAKARGAAPPDWSVISPPFRPLVGSVNAVTLVEPLSIQDELAQFNPTAMGAYMALAISALTHNVYPPVYDLKLAQAYYASINRKFQSPMTLSSTARYDLFSDRIIPYLRSIGVYYGKARSSNSVFSGLPLRTREGAILVALRGHWDVPYGQDIVYQPIDRLLMPGDVKDYEDLMGALVSGTLLVPKKYNPANLNNGAPLVLDAAQSGNDNLYWTLADQLMQVIVTMKIFWPMRRPSTLQLRQIFRLVVPRQTTSLNSTARLITTISQVYGIPEKVLQGIFKDASAPVVQDS